MTTPLRWNIPSLVYRIIQAGTHLKEFDCPTLDSLIFSHGSDNFWSRHRPQMFITSPCLQTSSLTNRHHSALISLHIFVNFLRHILSKHFSLHIYADKLKSVFAVPSRAMSSNQSPPGASQKDPKSAMPGVIPKVALQALEPCAGGFWTVTGQSNDGFSIAYIMNGGTQAISYTMRPCTTEEEVLKHCKNHLYDLPQCKYVQLSTATIANPKKLNNLPSLLPIHNHTSRLQLHCLYHAARL